MGEEAGVAVAPCRAQLAMQCDVAIRARLSKVCGVAKGSPHPARDSVYQFS